MIKNGNYERQRKMSEKKRKLYVRIMCIILAILLVGSMLFSVIASCI